MIAGKDILVFGSLILLGASVILAFLGFPQGVVSALISAVGVGTGIVWKWLDRRQSELPSSPNIKLSYMVNESPTIAGKRRYDFELSLEEGQRVRIQSRATEGKYSVGLMSETDYRLQKRSEKYDMEWYYSKQRGKVGRTFRARRKGTWYLVVWNEESYPLQVSVKLTRSS